MSKSGQDAPFLTLHKVPIYFAEDSWRSGRIGSGLWSTGLALAHYCGTQAAVHNVRRLCENKSSTLLPDDGGISVLELGSGNGFLAVCLAALATSHPDHVCIQDLVVTDTVDHLVQIRETVAANQDAIRNVKRVAVKEHVWGSFPSNDEDGSLTPSKFDLIIGSDVAYREHLYDPLIKSIRHYSHSNTVSLIGVTMADTTPEFFERLNAEGFVYQKFADHLLEPEFRGTTFAIFAIRLKNLST